MGRLLYRTQAYIIKAIRQAEFCEISQGVWEARSSALGLTAHGDTRDEAELKLHTMIAVFVFGAHGTGMPLPAVDGIGLDEDSVDADDQSWFWTFGWQAGEREASEDIAAGRLESFDSAEEFLASFAS